MEAILSRFSLQGRPLTCERYGQGHINLTYLVTTDSGRCYILQRLSRAAFHDIPALMRNVAAVTGFLAARSTDPRQTLHLIPTRDGENWVRDEAGEAWRVYDYVEDSICLQVPESPEDLYESAIAFGSFQRMLADFPPRPSMRPSPTFTTPRTATAYSGRRWPPTPWAGPQGYSGRSISSSPGRRKPEPCSGCGRAASCPCG